MSSSFFLGAPAAICFSVGVFAQETLGVAHDSRFFPPVLGFVGSGGITGVLYTTKGSRPFVPLTVPFGRFRFNDAPAVSFQSLEVAVGQFGEDKHSLSQMRRARFSRAECSPRTHVTSFFQVSEDMEEYRFSITCLGADDSFDVFEEDEGWTTSGNSICDVWVDVSWVFGCLSLSGA